MAAGTVTITQTTSNAGVQKITVAWLSDASGNANGVTFNASGQVYRMVTVPSATVAPSANYDIVINDAQGVDVTAGGAQNRHTSNTENIYPNAAGVVASTSALILVDGTLEVQVSNAGNAKAGTIILYVR